MKNKSNTSLSLRKLMLSALVAAPMVTLPSPLWAALPDTSSANVTSSAGAATTFSPISNTLTINTPDRSVLRWTSFGIDSTSTVSFVLPSDSSAVLNTVSTGNTTIDGVLTSNGSVSILNQNGIIVNGTASIDTKGLTLSTLPDAEVIFQANGALALSGTPTVNGDITFNGTPTVKVGTSGNLYLAGRNVAVSGTITAGQVTVSAKRSADQTGGVAGIGKNAALTIGAYGTTDIFNVNTPGTGNLTVTGDGGVNFLNAVDVRGGTLKITSGGAVNQASGTLAVGDKLSNPKMTIDAGNNAVTLTSFNANGKELGITVTAGDTSLTAGANDYTLNASTINGNLTLGNSNGSIKSGGDTTVTGLNVTMTATKASGDGPSIAFKGPGNLVFPTLTATGNSKAGINVTSTTGSVQLGTVSATGGVTATAQTDILQTSTIKAPGLTAEAKSGSITLLGLNDVDTLTLKSAPGGAKFNDTDGIRLDGGATAGAVEITAAGNVVFGEKGSSGVAYNSTLKVTTTVGDITDASDNITVGGALTLSAPGNIVLDGSNSRGLGLNNRYGQINATAANVSVYESSTLNLGNITTAGNLVAISTAGDIINNGQLRIGGTTMVGAGSMTAPGNISLDYTAATGSGNQLVGPIGVMDTYTLFSGLTVPSSTDGIGDYLANNLTVINEGTTVIAGIKNTQGQGIKGDLNVTTVAGNESTIRALYITNGGADYAAIPAITISAPPAGGTQATADAVMSSDGKSVTGITITNPGAGYVGTPTISIAVGAGGATKQATAAIVNNGVVLGGVTADQAVVVGGKVTLNSPNQIVAKAGNGITSYTLGAGGNVDVNTGSAATYNATLTETSGGHTATMRSGDTLTIGTVTSNYTGVTTFGSGNKKAVQDSVSGISIYGPVTFSSNGAVNITKAGHNFGGLTVNTGNDNSATLIESGSLRLVGASVGKGSLTLTSTTGDIFQDASSTGINFANTGSNKGNFTASAGKVTLDDPTLKNSFQNVAINVTAGSDAVVKVANSNLTLGNITTGGTFTADVSASGRIVSTAVTPGTAPYTGPLTVVISAPVTNGTQAVGTSTVAAGNPTALTLSKAGLGYTSAPSITVTDTVAAPAVPGAGAVITAVVQGNEIVQASGTKINAFGTTTLKTTNNKVTLTNTGNRFGGLVVSTGTGDVALTELTTMNLKSVATSGKFTAISEAGSIIDSTDATIVPNSVIIGGDASFTAKNDITLGLSSSQYNTVALNAGGNVSLLDTAGNTTLGAVSVRGTLDVTNTAASGSITQSGSGTMIVDGNTTFMAANGAILLTNSGNQFGGLRFIAGNGGAQISEATDMNLRAGTISTGNVTLSTGGAFLTSGSGGSTFTGDLTITANGTITANSLLVIGNLTLWSPATKNIAGSTYKAVNSFGGGELKTQ